VRNLVAREMQVTVTGHAFWGLARGIILIEAGHVKELRGIRMIMTSPPEGSASSRFRVVPVSRYGTAAMLWTRVGVWGRVVLLGICGTRPQMPPIQRDGSR